MLVANITIKNFRGIKNGSVRLGMHSVLIGANNSGKTTVIEALALLLGRDKLVRNLTEHDFFGTDPQPENRIRIIATVTNFGTDDPNDKLDWFRPGRGVPKWFDSSTGIVHPLRDGSDWELCTQIGFAARWDKESLSVETARYFHDDDSLVDVFGDEVWTTVPMKLLTDVGFFLVPASRTWDKMISFGSDLFRRVIATVEGTPSEALLEQRDRLRNPSKKLEDDGKLKDLVSQVNGELSRLFSRTPKLRLFLTATDSEAVMDAVVPHYQFSDAPAIPSKRQGTGLISLQTLLLLLQFGQIRVKDGRGFIVALEEPELHVPLPLQRRLMHRLRSLCTQTITTTHSPNVAAFYDPTDIIVLQNRAGELTANILSKEPLPLEATNGLRKLLYMNREDAIAALMHEIVLVPEGRTDFDLFRLLLKATELNEDWNDSTAESTSFGTFVGVVPTHDATVVETFELLQAVHPDVIVLVDGDVAGKEYINKLTTLSQPPAVIFRWPDDWAIEQVVGWIIEADPDAALPALADWLPEAPESVKNAISILEKKPKDGGAKGDPIVYEGVATTVGDIRGCMDRLRSLLSAMSAVCVARDTETRLFERDDTSSSEKTSVFVFKP